MRPGGPAQRQPMPGGPVGHPYQPPLPVPTTRDGVPLAPYGSRVVAALVDSILVWIIIQIVVSIVNAATGAGVRLQAAMNAYLAYFLENANNPENMDFGYALSILMTKDLYIQIALTSAIAIAYYAVFVGAISATPGKLLTGLRVVPAEQGTQTRGLDWWRALLRSVTFEVFGRFLILVQLVNILWPLWDKRKQALHDKIAGTQVVKIK